MFITKQTLGRTMVMSLPLTLFLGCSGNSLGGDEIPPGSPGNPIHDPNCIGRGCQINIGCPADLGPTTLSGTVTIPAGNLPLYNAKVYIPAFDVPPAPNTGPACESCDQVIPGDAVASATTDINGNFTLRNVPSGTDIPLVIRLGKWRRVVTIPAITDCTSTPLDSGMTRMPRNKTEGNIPKFALTTGSADAMECILRKNKLGLDDSEFTLPSGDGRVNLYVGGVGVDGVGANKFKAGFNGVTQAMNFPAANPWWNTATNWDAYDAVMLSCEGQQNANDKNAMAHAALQSYIDRGGRVFASHWHNIWISGATNAVKNVATIATNNTYQNDSTTITADINLNFERSKALADWLLLPSVAGSTQRGKLDIKFSRQTITGRDMSLTQDWVNFQPPNFTRQAQYFSFNAPVGASANLQCGQMVFTDIHVSGDPNGDTSRQNTPFPDGCKTNGLTPQEKALIFMLFDLTNCLQPIIG